MPWKHIREAEELLQSFLTLVLDGGKWLTSCSSSFTPGKETQYPLNRRLGGPQSWPGQFLKREKKKTSYHKLGFEPRRALHVLWHYQHWWIYIYCHVVRVTIFFFPCWRVGSHWNNNENDYVTVICFIPYICLYCLLLHVQHCCHLFVGKVANGILGTLHSKRHYWKDGIKLKNKEREQNQGQIRSRTSV
jgi:hypothetical protein